MHTANREWGCLSVAAMIGQIIIGLRCLSSALIHSVAVTVVRFSCAPLWVPHIILIHGHFDRVQYGWHVVGLVHAVHILR